MGANTRKLMDGVAARQSLAAVGGRAYLVLLCAAGAYGVLLLVSRLLALVPNYWHLAQVPLLAVLAVAVALAFHHRPTPRESARLIDRRMNTNDLFLTAALIQTAAGAYKPLVLKDAESAAASIAPRDVVPFAWWRRTRNGALPLAALCAAVLWVPQLDPFGKDQQRQQKVEQRKQLEDSRKATELRLATLKEQADEGALSKTVVKAIDDLKKDLGAMKPTDQQGNLQRLNAQQAALSQMWKKAGEQQAADALKQSFEPQQFGEGTARKTEEWKKELAKGDAGGMKKEMEDLKAMADKLAKMPEGAEKRALQEKMNQELQDLANLAASQASSPALNAALQRAMEQLAMSGSQGLSQDALKALQESLQLSEAEMERLAQSIRDMKALEDAMHAVQLARRLNDAKSLSGDQSQGMGSMADYQALYEQMLAARQAQGIGQVGQGQGRGNGPGMGNQGIGQGGVAPEDPSAKTAFTNEKSQSALTAGRILLSMKSQGLSETGEAASNYEQYVQEVKQGASEAIVHEQVPPAYHETIRKYFDTLEAPNEQPPAE